jgi:hypothetical protein
MFLKERAKDKHHVETTRDLQGLILEHSGDQLIFPAMGKASEPDYPVSELASGYTCCYELLLKGFGILHGRRKF